MLKDELRKIEAIVGRHPDGIGVQSILRELHAGLPRRTLQYRLGRLVDMGRLVKEGRGPSTTYRLPSRLGVGVHAEAGSRETQVGADVVPDDLKRLRDELRQRYLSQPADHRAAVGYRREFLEIYRPNVSAYLSTEERTRLRGMGELVSSPGACGNLCPSDPRSDVDRSLLELEPSGGQYLFPARHQTPDRTGRPGRGSGHPRDADDRQPQARHRVSRRERERGGVRSPHGSQPARDTGGEPTAGSGGTGPIEEDAGGH